MDSVIQFFVPLTVFLFLLMAVFLLSVKKGNQRANQFLGLFFLCLGLAVLDVSLQVMEVYLRFPHLAYWITSLPFLYGPLLYLYTKYYVFEEAAFAKKDWLHFVPFGVSILITIFTYHIHDIAYKTTFLRKASEPGLESMLTAVLLFSLMVAYLLSAIRLLKRRESYLRDNYSEIEKYSLNWLKYILYGFLGILLLSLVTQIVSFTVDDKSYLVYVLFLLLVVMFCFIIVSVFKGLRDNRMLIGINDFEESKTKSASTDEQQHVEGLIVREVEDKQLFLNPELKISDLAEAVGQPVRLVSEAINQRMGVTFFDFINSKRVDFIKKRMVTATDPKKTVLEYMYEGGFNSKSSFNTAFKKHAGTTPSTWKKQQNH